MKHFCSKCGRPTIYALELPKFCSQCGSEFVAATKAKTDDDFSVVTKQQDKSVHDQALEKAKEKYQGNNPKFVPQPKPDPKNYPNPARASIKYKLVDDDEQTEDEDGDIDYEDHSIAVNPDLFAKVKPKFTLQQTRNASESFENIVTQGYASNYQPMDPAEMRTLSGDIQNSTPDSVLEQFKREAGSIRQRD